MFSHNDNMMMIYVYIHCSLEVCSSVIRTTFFMTPSVFCAVFCCMLELTWVISFGLAEELCLHIISFRTVLKYLWFWFISALQPTCTLATSTHSHTHSLSCCKPLNTICVLFSSTSLHNWTY
jgi:hypothetical protein